MLTDDQEEGRQAYGQTCSGADSQTREIHANKWKEAGAIKQAGMYMELLDRQTEMHTQKQRQTQTQTKS